jgi:hypothetical protein
MAIRDAASISSWLHSLRPSSSGCWTAPATGWPRTLISLTGPSSASRPRQARFPRAPATCGPFSPAGAPPGQPDGLQNLAVIDPACRPPGATSPLRHVRAMSSMSTLDRAGGYVRRLACRQRGRCSDCSESDEPLRHREDTERGGPASQAPRTFPLGRGDQPSGHRTNLWRWPSHRRSRLDWRGTAHCEATTWQGSPTSVGASIEARSRPSSRRMCTC